MRENDTDSRDVTPNGSNTGPEDNNLTLLPPSQQRVVCEPPQRYPAKESVRKPDSLSSSAQFSHVEEWIQILA